MFDRFRRKDPMRRLTKVPPTRLLRLQKEMEYDLDKLDHEITFLEQDQHKILKQGVGAPHRRKVRLAAKARGKDIEIDAATNSYFVGTKELGVITGLIAMQKAGLSNRTPHIHKLNTLLSLDSPQDLADLVRDASVTSEAEQEPVNEAYATIRAHSERLRTTPDDAGEDYIGVMEELEAIDDDEMLDAAIRDRVVNRNGNAVAAHG